MQTHIQALLEGKKGKNTQASAQIYCQFLSGIQPVIILITLCDRFAKEQQFLLSPRTLSS